jgi:hypothetical protein
MFSKDSLQKRPQNPLQEKRAFTGSVTSHGELSLRCHGQRPTAIEQRNGKFIKITNLTLIAQVWCPRVLAR